MDSRGSWTSRAGLIEALRSADIVEWRQALGMEDEELITIAYRLVEMAGSGLNHWSGTVSK